MSAELTDFLLKFTFERKYPLVEQENRQPLVHQSCPLSSTQILSHIYSTINAKHNHRPQKNHKFSLSSEDTTPQSPFKCNCKKSKCLKLYCECFARGSFCQNCNCQCCQNTTEFSDIRAKAIDEMMTKTLLPFQHKNSSMKGCNCKKTGCIKKYCQCFNQKRPCGQHCKCINCQNCNKE